MTRAEKENLELAYYIEMGKTAFNKGLKCIPAHDENVMSVIADQNKVCDTNTVLKAWILGWTRANLENES